MKTFGFQSRLGPKGTLTVPNELASEVGVDRSVRVILVIGDAGEEEDWQRATQEQFLKGYSERDSIYDDI